MRIYAEMDVFGTWYERLDADALIVLIQSRKWKKSSTPTKRVEIVSDLDF